MEGHDGSDTCGLMVITPDPSGRAKVMFNVFRTISREDYERFSRASGAVQSYLRGSLKVYAETALTQFTSSLGQIRRFLAQRLASNAVLVNVGNWQVAVRCSALTFAAALHLYQEQVLVEVKRHHGAAGEEVAQAQAMFSETYDASFDYRLTYRLRNSMVHHSIDSVRLVLHSSEETRPSGLITQSHLARVYLDRKVFLSSKGISRAMRTSLEQMSVDLDLGEVFPRALDALSALHAKLQPLTTPRLDADLAALRQLDGLFGDVAGDRALVQIPGSTSSGGPTSLPHSPLRAELFALARSRGEAAEAAAEDPDGQTGQARI